MYVNGVFDSDSNTIKSIHHLKEAVDKQLKPFCLKNNIDYDINKEKLFKYNIIKIQNLNLKKKNDKDVQEGLKQKVNYANCSKFIKDYAEQILNYNDSFEYIETRKGLIDEILTKLKTEKDTSKIDDLNSRKSYLENEIKVGLTKQPSIKDDETGFNDKESCSLILLMALLEKDGTCCGVLKEGVFFDGKYSKLRCFLINNFNVTDVISVDANSFENTTTKTSIIVFKNNGRTKKIRFQELVVDPEKENVLEYIENSGNEITQLKGEIKDVKPKFICNATYKQLSEVKITYNKNKEPRFDLDYSLNYKNYKDYKVDCPEGYELKKLGKEITYKQKANRPASFANEKGKYRFYTSSDKIKRCDECDFTDNELKIIMGTGGVGSLFIDTKFTCSSDNFVITTDNIYKTLYIYDYIKNNWDSFIDKMFGGSTLGHINKERLNNLEIPFPVDINKLKPQLDKIYNLHQQISTNTELIPQKEKDVMDLIKKLTEEGKNGIDYEEHKLGDIITCNSGKFNTKDMVKNGTYPFYNASVNNPVGFINNACFVEDKQLLFIKSGGNSSNKVSDSHGLGLTLLVKGKCSSNVHVSQILIIKKYNISYEYLYYYLKNLKYCIQENAKYSTGLGSVDMEHFKKLIIKVLFDTQIKKYNIQKLFDEIDELKNNLESSKTNYQKELKDLFKDFKNDEEEDAQELQEQQTEEAQSEQQHEQQAEEDTQDTQEQQTEQTQESEEEHDMVEYRNVEYIVLNNIMYPYNKKDGTKGEAFGELKDGKVKKYKK